MVKHFDIPQPIKRNGSRLSDVKEEGTARNRRAAGAAGRRASRISGFVRFAVVLTYDLARGGRNMPDETDFSDLDLSGFLDPVLATGGSHRGGRRIRKGPQRARALRLEELVRRTGLTRQEIYEQIEDGRA